MQSNFVNETSSSDIRPSFWHLKGKVDFIDQWPLMSSPIPVITIMTCYLAFVLKIGPYLMEKRPPYQLTNVLIAYNIIQVIASMGLAIGLGILGYCYMLAKLSELLDTVFFVLRKKQNQVTFLHVYHHTLMFTFMWYGMKYEINEHGIFFGTLNAIVHVVMYGYYCLSAMPGMSKYLWWKKYITLFQLAQFLAAFVHILLVRAISDCPPSNIGVSIITVNALFFYHLFSKFYKSCYSQPNNNNDKCETNEKSSMNGASYANGTSNGKESQSQRNYRKKPEKIN